MSDNSTHIIKQAVDIVEGPLTDEQLQALRESEELRRAVLLAEDVQTLGRRDQEPVDVEERLKQFHSSHPSVSDTNGIGIRRLFWPLLAAAAVALALVWINLGKADHLSADDPFFQQTAQATSGEISLQSTQGTAAVATAHQSQSLTMADIREIFAEAEKHQEDVTLHVPQGKSADITLPDGSTVYLHPGSRLLFPTRFPSDKRVVKLDGEAYFKVAHKDDQPFIVMTNKMETTVLGTEFNINTHTREVVLVSGSIRVKTHADATQRLLKPGQQLTEDAEGHISLSSVDTTPYEYWRDGYIYFDNAPLSEILSTLAANYNKQIVFRDTMLQQLRMRFFVERNKGVERAVEMLNSMNAATVSIDGDRLVVE